MSTTATPTPRPTRTYLGREAAIAAEHLAVGATALRGADFAREARYGQALFALSVGLERGCKLALTIDQSLTTGTFASSADLRKFGHRIKGLVSAVDAIATARNFVDPDARYPASALGDAVVSEIDTFADNVSRYFNLEAIGPNPTGIDPVASGHQNVTVPILVEHMSQKQLTAALAHFAGIAELEEQTSARVRFHSETLEPIESLAMGSLHGRYRDIAIPWERMYVLRLGRFLGAALTELEGEAAKLGRSDIPHMPDYFGVYVNSDSTFRSRKTWTIY